MAETEKSFVFDTLADEYMGFVIGDEWKGPDRGKRKATTWEEAYKRAHLTFSLSKKQLIHPETKKHIDAWGVFRDDTHELMNTVGRNYKIVPFSLAFAFVDGLIHEEPGSYYECAGALGNGNKFWTLCRFPKADISIQGTNIKMPGYLLFLSSHDGTLATTCRLTIKTEQCNNTLVTPLTRASGEVLKIKHTANVDQRLEVARRLMTGVVEEAQLIERQLNVLSTREMTARSFLTVVNNLFPAGVSTRRSNYLLRIAELFEDNDGDSCPEVKGTAYSLLNSITDFVDHTRGIRLTEQRKGFTESMARAESAIFGSGMSLKQRALQILMQETKDNPLSPRRVLGSVSPSTSSKDDYAGLFNEVRNAVDVVTKRSVVTKKPDETVH